MAWTKAIIIIGAILFSGFASAKPKPRCFDLSRNQADTAVALMKRATAKGSSLIFQTKKEKGLVKPLSIWAEPGKKKGTYRVRIDNRPVDISLIYVSRGPGERKAWNVAWLAGCRPALNKPISIHNF